MLPQTFEEWENCITNDCNIKLTKDFTMSRLKVYENKKSPETKKFVQLYGEEHLNNVIYWLRRAGERLR